MRMALPNGSWQARFRPTHLEPTLYHFGKAYNIEDLKQKTSATCVFVICRSF